MAEGVQYVRRCGESGQLECKDAPPPPRGVSGDPLLTYVASNEMAALVQKSLDVEGTAERVRSRQIAHNILAEIKDIASKYGRFLDPTGSCSQCADVDIVDSDGRLVYARMSLSYLIESVPWALLRSRGGRGSALTFPTLSSFATASEAAQ